MTEIPHCPKHYIPRSRMLLSQPPTLLSLLFTILSSSHTSDARPNPPDDERKLLESRYHYLSERDCANPCGWTGQVCCQSGQTCGTDAAGEAVCNGGGVAANVQAAGSEVYTTIWVETDFVTHTSTYTSYFGAAPTPAAPTPAQISGISCNNGLGESPCGTICCATGQYCAYAGQCAASNGNGDASSSSYLGAVVTAAATNTPPLRATSNAVTTVTSTGTKTTTTQFGTPSAAPTAAGGSQGMSTASNNGLTGGQIAGIVIGVILGIIILILLLLCCCAASAADAILGFFGLRNRRRRRDTTIIEEHRHHSSNTGAGRRWFGVGPTRVDQPKKSSGVGGLTAVAGGLGALAIILGLKRRRDRKKEKTEYSGSSYYSDYYSSESE